jgi:hypothetical protein
MLNRVNVNSYKMLNSAKTRTSLIQYNLLIYVK